MQGIGFRLAFKEIRFIVDRFTVRRAKRLLCALFHVDVARLLGGLLLALVGYLGEGLDLLSSSQVGLGLRGVPLVVGMFHGIGKVVLAFTVSN